MLGHKCGICLSSRSEHLPPAKHAHEDWCAFTSCGHVYHLSCIEQWHRIGNEHGCPARCASRDVKRQKRAGSRIVESLPYLRLYVDAPRAPGAAVAPSSDAVDAPEVEVEPRRDKGKGKARAVPDDEDDAESERDDEPGAMDEVTRLRRQRSEALDTVRRQRDELAQLRERLRVAEAARAAARTTYNRAEREPPFMPRGPHPSDVPEDGVHDPAEAYDALYHDPFSDADDEPEDCKECGHAHAEDEGCRYERGSSELRDAEREIAALRRDARRNDPQAVAALAAQLRAHQLRYDELEARHRELDARVGDLVRQRNEAHSVYHEAKIKWQEEVRRLQQQLNASGESGEEVIRQLGQEIEAKEHEIFLLKAAQDGHKHRADEACEKAAEAAARARRESLDAQAEAKRRIEVVMEHVAEEVRLRKRVEHANKAALDKIKKLKVKNKELQTKRGILAPDTDDDDDDANAFLPPNASITLSRSRISLTPDDPASTFRINNNARLLASPTKRSRRRTPFDETCDVSLETDPVEDADAADADANAECEDDELEYVDVDMAHDDDDDDDEVENRPPHVELDSDSDIEIVEPVPSKYFSSSAPARPFGARNTVAADDPFPPPRSTSGKKRAFGLTTLAEGSSAALASSSSSWASKKPALSQSRADKYLPDFASAAAVRKAAAVGPKHKVKRR